MNYAWLGLLIIPSLLILWLGYLWGHGQQCGSETHTYFTLMRPPGYKWGDEGRLATYLDEVKRGVVHTEETDREMKKMREAYQASLLGLLSGGCSRYVSWQSSR